MHHYRMTDYEHEKQRQAQADTFAEWLRQVDAACERIAGVSVHDLADCCFADWHDDGITPTQAARRALRGGE